MDCRFLVCACLLLFAACSNAGAPKAQREADGVTAKNMPAETAVTPKDVAATAVVTESGALPDDVSQYVNRRSECDHFRGEEAYDEERGRFLREKLDSLCKGSDAELAQLKSKYASRGDITARLSTFDIKIE